MPLFGNHNNQATLENQSNIHISSEEKIVFLTLYKYITCLYVIDTLSPGVISFSLRMDKAFIVDHYNWRIL